MSEPEGTIVAGVGIVDDNGEVVLSEQEAGTADFPYSMIVQRALRADEQAKIWKADAQYLNFLLKEHMDRLEVKHLDAATGNATRVKDSETTEADTERMFQWLKDNEIDDLELIKSLIGKLDGKAVEAFFQVWTDGMEDPGLVLDSMREIVSKKPRNGYVRVTPKKELHD